MKLKKKFYLSQTRLATYSRQDRKRIESMTVPEGGLLVFSEYLSENEREYILSREKDANLLWCATHGEWEHIETGCEKEFTPPEQRDKIEEWELSKGGEEPGISGDTLEAMVEAAKKLDAQQQQQEEGEEIDYSQAELEGKEVVWKDKPIRGINWVKAAGKKILATEDGRIKVGSAIKPDQITWQFDVDSDGNVKEHFGESVGAIKGSPADKQQNGKGKGDGKKPPPTPKWTKVVLNICPTCKTESITYVKVDGKRPTDPMEWLDFEEKDCGCQNLTFKGIPIPGTYGALTRSEKLEWGGR